jgi:hypothetical protein
VHSLLKTRTVFRFIFKRQTANGGGDGKLIKIAGSNELLLRAKARRCGDIMPQSECKIFANPN